MAKLSESQQRALRFINHQMLTKGFCHHNAPAIDGGYTAATMRKLEESGLIVYKYKSHEILLTPAGLAYLYQDAPMVDQPQPAPEVEPVVNLSAALLLEAVRKFGDFMPE